MPQSQFGSRRPGIRVNLSAFKTSKARWIASLWLKQHGLCYWCAKPACLPNDPRYLRSTGALSGKAATIDHLFSRHHPLRARHEHVMACSTCNGMRSRVECLTLELHGKLEPRIYRPDEPITKRRGEIVIG